MSELSLWIGLFVALALLWWPSYEDERLKRRRRDRELAQARQDICIHNALEVGFWVPFDELVDCGHEWLHWQNTGRGRPYA
jgi:hypothetical protein